MMEHTVTPLFPIPLYSASLGSLENNIRNSVNSLEFERMPSEDGHYTVDKFVLDREEFAPLKQKIQNHIEQFLYEVLNCDPEVNFEIQNSWINKHNENDSAGLHNHSNSLISGVYYIDVDDVSGAISFLKDKGHINLWPDVVNIQTDYDSKKLNIFNTQWWNYIPKKNDLIMFPSMLYHQVEENRSKKIRYSLAFNVFPRGNLGGTLNKLKI